MNYIYIMIVTSAARDVDDSCIAFCAAKAKKNHFPAPKNSLSGIEKALSS